MPKSRHSMHSLRAHGRRHSADKPREKSAHQTGDSKRADSPCQSDGALPLSRLPMSYLGVIELAPGNRYRTPDGLFITWGKDTLTVCEPYAGLNKAVLTRNIWHVTDAPPVVVDALQNRIPFPTSCAIFVLSDGSKLLMGSDGTGPVTHARYFYSGISLTVENLKGYSAYGITIFQNAGLSKIPEDQ